MAGLPGRPTLTTLGERKVTYARMHAGKYKAKLLKASMANLYDPKAKSFKQVKIKAVVEGANPHFVRSNILTKGAVVETDAGRARITSRPGQEATVNAVLVEEKKK